MSRLRETKVSDFSDFYLDEGKCPSCGTEATYKIAENSFGCKCTYELETDIELGKKLERERLVKLLESKRCYCLDNPIQNISDDREELMKHMNCEFIGIDWAIRLLKEEQK